MTDRASPQSFSFAAGESFVLQFDVDQVITGMTVRFAAKRRFGSTAVLSSPGTATTSVTGARQCKVAVADENTESLRGSYRYSVEIEDGFGDKSEVAYGYLTFNPSMV